MAARCHVSLYRFSLLNVYDRVEEECFSVLAAEILEGRTVLLALFFDRGG